MRGVLRLVNNEYLQRAALPIERPARYFAASSCRLSPEKWSAHHRRVATVDGEHVHRLPLCLNLMHRGSTPAALPRRCSLLAGRSARLHSSGTYLTPRMGYPTSLECERILRLTTVRSAHDKTDSDPWLNEMIGCKPPQEVRDRSEAPGRLSLFLFRVPLHVAIDLVFCDFARTHPSRGLSFLIAACTPRPCDGGRRGRRLRPWEAAVTS